MRFALMSEPQQGLSYAEILALAQAAERAGFETYFRSDHYSSFPGPAGLPATDAWTSLAGLARETSRIGLGVLVSPVTFRAPGTLAKIVTTVDEMSDGRVELGLGAGWNDDEHEQHGLAFPAQGERFAMLEEQLAIIHGLWTEPDGWSYAGAHWQIRNARFAPRPVARAGRRHPNIILGGHGGPRLARLAASYADEINISSSSAAEAAIAYGRVAQACRAMDRDPETVIRSAMTGALVGRTEAEVRSRVAELMRMFGSDGDLDDWLAERRTRWIMGTPSEARARVAEFEDAGAQRVMLQVFLPRDLEHVELLGELFAA
jgi:F420-dependent oxidoreductase-like protein